MLMEYFVGIEKRRRNHDYLSEELERGERHLEDRLLRYPLRTEIGIENRLFEWTGMACPKLSHVTGKHFPF